MEKMTRRGFLSGVAATAVAATLPPVEMLHGWFPIQFIGDHLPMGLERGMTYYWEGVTSRDSKLVRI